MLIYLVGFSPRWIFYLFLLVFALIGLSEYYRLTLPDLSPVLKLGTYLFVILFFYIIFKQVFIVIGLFSLIIILPMLYYLFSNPLKGERYLSEVGTIVVGMLYVCLPLAMLMQIDNKLYYLRYGIKGIWIFFLLVVLVIW